MGVEIGGLIAAAWPAVEEEDRVAGGVPISGVAEMASAFEPEGEVFFH